MTNKLLRFAEPGLNLPIEAVTQTFAFLGKRGGGKSYAATKLCELMLEAGAQIVALDVVGNWCGLRIPATKGGKAFDSVLVFGGLNGDFEINPKAGRIIAETIINKNLCAVVDISQFIHSEQTRFAYDFLTTLFEKKKKSPSAIHLFFEEAQELVPQNLPAGAKGENYAARMLSAGERLVKLGRNYGIGCSLISQRPQEVNKKVLNQSEVFLAFQMTGIQERKTVAEWVKDKGSRDDLVEMLPYLEIGQALCWSPSWLRFEDTVRILPKLTADVSATPKVGAAIGQTKTLKPVDVEALKESIAELTDEIEKDTPSGYKKEIATLKQEASQLRKQLEAKPAGELMIKEVPLLPVKEIEALTAELAGFRKDYIGKLERIAQGFEALNGQNTINQIEQKVGKLLSAILSVKTPVVPVRTPQPKSIARAAAAQTSTVSGSTGDLSKAERLILQALYWTKDERTTPAKIGFYSGYSHKSGSFASTLSSLRGRGLLIGQQITPDGETLASSYADAKPTGAELREWLRPKLNKCENELLDVLVARPGERLDNETLASLTPTQYSSASGSFASALSRLRTLEAAEGYGREGVKAADVFFE
jgi:uncharacterized protein